MTKTLNIEECAEILKVSASTAMELAASGALPGAKLGRAWVFLEEDVLAYLRSEIDKQVRERRARIAANPPTWMQVDRTTASRRKPLPKLPRP